MEEYKKFSVEQHIIDGSYRTFSLNMGQEGSTRRKKIEEATLAMRYLHSGFTSMTVRYMDNDSLSIACTTSQTLLWLVKARPAYRLREDGSFIKVQPMNVNGSKEGA